MKYYDDYYYDLTLILEGKLNVNINEKMNYKKIIKKKFIELKKIKKKSNSLEKKEKIKEDIEFYNYYN